MSWDVAVTLLAVAMTIGISMASAFVQFDQTYLGPLSDGESDNIVTGAPVAIPTLPPWFTE